MDAHCHPRPADPQTDEGGQPARAEDGVPTFVDFRSELPKSQVGKILRRVLVEEEKAKQAQERGFRSARRARRRIRRIWERAD